MRRSTIALVLLGVGVLAPVVSLEGRAPIAIASTAALAAAAALVAQPISGIRRSLVMAVGIALAWTFIQIVPVPVGGRQTLDAGIEGVAAPRWWPLHIEPVAGVLEVAKLLAVACVYVAAASAIRRGHRERAEWIAIGAGAFAALVTLLHVVASADHVYGLFTHEHVRSRLPGPFANENHLAALLGAVIPLALLQAIRETTIRARASWSALVAVMMFVVLATSSRSGIIGTLAGLAAFGLLQFSSSRRDESKRRWRDLGATLVSLAIVATGACVLWLAWSPAPEDWEIGVEEKAELMLRALDLAASAPWTGVGRGAFSVAFVGYEGTLRRFTHPENFVVQWAAEWGLPVAAVVFALLADGVLRATGVREGRTRRAAIAGLVSLGVHDLADYSTEVLAVTCTASVLVALACEERAVDRTGRAPNRTWFALPSAALAAAVTAVALAPYDSGAQERAIAGMLDRGEHHAALDASFAGMRWHPREPTFPLLGASAAAAEGDRRAMALLNRAMVLAPGWHGPHLEAARLLIRVNAIDQAWVELRVADELAPTSARAIECGLLRAPSGAEPAIRAYRHSPRREEELDALSGCGVPDAVSIAIDEDLAGTRRIGPRVRAASRATRAGNPQQALALLEGIRSEDDPRVALVRGQVYASAGDRDTARVAFAAASRGARRQPRLLVEVARAQASIQDAPGMRATVEELIATAQGSAERLSDAYILRGELDEAMGNQEDAMDAFEHAQSILPGPAPLQRIATLAERRGETLRAYRAFREWCRLASSGPGCDGVRRLSGGN